MKKKKIEASEKKMQLRPLVCQTDTAFQHYTITPILIISCLRVGQCNEYNFNLNFIHYCIYSKKNYFLSKIKYSKSIDQGWPNFFSPLRIDFQINFFYY